MSFSKAVLLAGCLAGLGACSPIGIITGTGALIGVAAVQEGGIKGTARDMRISADIQDQWFQYDLETFAKLKLSVDQGRVLITGVVQDPEDRVEAVRRAWQVEGVEQVINEIRVADGEGLPGYIRDAWISTRLRTALTFDKKVKSVNYSIETVQGTVYLMGVGQNRAELEHVIEVARTTPYVKQVISYVTLPEEKPQKPLPEGAPLP